MNYTDEKQEISKENRFIIQVMIMYIEDYEFLYECMGYDTKNIILDVEDLIVDLIDLQRDDVYYCPLTIA